MRPTLRVFALSLALLAGCGEGRAKYPSAEAGLKLDRVVLYRNGIGYFERVGDVDGDILRIKVRKDQVNDLLKSLTVVEREGGKAVSVSMPLDPQTWANAAIATLTPGRGNLAEVLDSLRGTQVTLSTQDGTMSGRIVMVEELRGQSNDDAVRYAPPRPIPTPEPIDHRVTLLDGDSMKVVKLSRVKGVTLEDGDLAMQFNRTLDASAGEGMFQQVEIQIRLVGASSHDLLVSYVVSAPMWKPTYRVVLPKEKKGKALLQAWAVVDNTSGEDWGDVSLGLTSGAPIAFRYDLHTPREVERADLTESGVRRQAQALVGETTYEESLPPPPPMAPSPATANYDKDADGILDAEDEAPADRKGDSAGRASAGGKMKKAPSAPKAEAAKPMDAPAGAMANTGSGYGRLREEQKQEIDLESLRRSTLAQAKAQSASGLTRFDIDGRVTVPDGTSTMVAIVNADVDGEETFLYKPGGAGIGYEANPYRVVRFRNSTPFVLEPGPISIYAGGSFVGEGLSEAVGTNTSATIPFAVEPGILVSQTSKYDGDEMRLIKISRGILEVESFGRKVSTYSVKSQTMVEGFNLLVRHPKAGWNYELATRPDGTEDLPDGYLVKVSVPPGQREGSITVTEQTPSRREISIWEAPALPLLEKLIVATDLLPEARLKLQPVVDRRREIGRIDEQLDGLRKQRDTIDQRAGETRRNLEAIQKDNAAGTLRQKLTKRLEDFASEGNKLGRDMAELEAKRLEKRIELDDILQDLDLTAPPAKKGPGAAAPATPVPAAAVDAGAAAPAPAAPPAAAPPKGGQPKPPASPKPPAQPKAPPPPKPTAAPPPKPATPPAPPAPKK